MSEPDAVQAAGWNQAARERVAVANAIWRYGDAMWRQGQGDGPSPELCVSQLWDAIDVLVVAVRCAVIREIDREAAEWPLRRQVAGLIERKLESAAAELAAARARLEAAK